jgi:hypothetical protein
MDNTTARLPLENSPREAIKVYKDRLILFGIVAAVNFILLLILIVFSTNSFIAIVSVVILLCLGLILLVSLRSGDSVTIMIQIIHLLIILSSVAYSGSLIFKREDNRKDKPDGDAVRS